MKLGLVLTLLLATAVLLTAAAGDAKVTYISHDKVEKGGTIFTALDLIVMQVSRTGPGEVEVHDKETDTFHVLDGSATLVTGGTIYPSYPPSL